MLKNHSFTLNSRFFFLAGMTLLCVGITCNEWTLTKAFSQDGVLEPITRIEIWIFNIAFTLTGSALIRYRESIKPREIFLRLSQTHPRILASSIGMIFAGIMLLCAEGAFYVLNSYAKANILIERSTEKYYLPDGVLGYKPWPMTRYSAVKKKDGNIIYNVVYSTDEYSRRVTPFNNLHRRVDFLLFFGCSFTFGEGVGDDETMPFYVSELAPRYRLYNYGYIGYGPQNMLAKLQSGEIPEEIGKTHGMAIYTFIDNHVHRAIGSMSIATNWGSDLPFYTIDSDDKLFRKGSLTSGRPVLSALYSLLSKSQIVRYFKMDFPARIDDYDIKITYRMIEESRNVFRSQFRSDDFYVLLYPGSNYAKKMIPYFKSAGIKYLDYSDMVTGTESYIEGDGHPTAKAHRAVAERLTRDLGISGADRKS